MLNLIKNQSKQETALIDIDDLSTMLPAAYRKKRNCLKLRKSFLSTYLTNADFGPPFLDWTTRHKYGRNAQKM